jgi:hypothetical protein
MYIYSVCLCVCVCVDVYIHIHIGTKVYVRDSDLGIVKKGQISSAEAARRAALALGIQVDKGVEEEAAATDAREGETEEGWFYHELVGLTCLNIPDSVFNMFVGDGEEGGEGGGEGGEEEEGVMLRPEDCSVIGEVIGVIPADELSSVPGVGQDLLEVRLGDASKGFIDDEKALRVLVPSILNEP